MYLASVGWDGTDAPRGLTHGISARPCRSLPPRLPPPDGSISTVVISDATLRPLRSTINGSLPGAENLFREGEWPIFSTLRP